MKPRKGQSTKQTSQPADVPVNNQPNLRDEWDAEAERTIDESALRGRPDWVEAIGDESESPGRIDRNLRDEWARRGEDDFVSDPTMPSDMPGWVGDDYDDEYPDETDDLLDNTNDGKVW